MIFLAVLEGVQESFSTGVLPGFRRTVYVCLLAHPSESTALSIVPCHPHDTHAHTYPTDPTPPLEMILDEFSTERTTLRRWSNRIPKFDQPGGPYRTKSIRRETVSFFRSES